MADFIKFIPKELFFDAQKVMRATDAGTRIALSKIGAFVRTRMKSRMRRRKRSARAGESPSVHAGQLRDLIYFGYDPIGKSVDIGPVVFKKGEAPRLNEFGGQAQRTEKSGKSITVHYQKHPFAAPALQDEIAAGTIPAAWAGAVKGN